MYQIRRRSGPREVAVRAGAGVETELHIGAEAEGVDEGGTVLAQVKSQFTP